MLYILPYNSPRFNKPISLNKNIKIAIKKMRVSFFQDTGVHARTRQTSRSAGGNNKYQY